MTGSVSASALAQDSAAPYMKLDKLSRSQVAALEAEVAQRVRRLPDAGTDLDKREEARARITRTAAIEGATQAALDAYAKICADELTPLLDHEVFETASDAVMVLAALDNENTAEAIGRGLRSRHDGVRLMSARAIQKLQPRLATDATRCRAVLRALGRAGERESDAHVLRVIYAAIDFKRAVRNFKYGANSAEALAQVFQTRVNRLSAGSRDELNEEEAVDVAVRCIADAQSAVKTKLTDEMMAFLGHALSRYFDPDTAPEYFPTLERLIVRMEEAVYAMAKATDVSISCERLKLNPKSANVQRQRPAAQKVMDCLHNAFPGAQRFLES